MPYDKRKELPENIRGVLPKEAQDIFKEAYNSAWDQYSDARDRQGDDSREEVAMKVAWSAVKQKYYKDQETSQWQKK